VKWPVTPATPVAPTVPASPAAPTVPETPRTAAPASSGWEAALADIAARAGIDPKYVESAIAATVGTTAKQAAPDSPPVEAETPAEPVNAEPPAAQALPAFPELPELPPPAIPVMPVMPWAQPPDDLMAGVSTVYSAPGLGLAGQKPEVPTPQPTPALLPDVPAPASPTLQLGLPDPSMPAVKAVSPVISIGSPGAEAATTMQFARPVVGKPVLPPPAGEPEPSGIPEVVGKPELSSQSADDFFGPLPSETSAPEEDAKADAVAGKAPEPKKRDKRQRAKDGDGTPNVVAAVTTEAGETASEKDGEDDATADDDETESAVKQKKGRKSRLPGPAQWAIEIAVWVVAALILSTLIRLFVVQLFVVPSGSMESTLEIGDRIAVLKYAQFQRGDIVVFSDPGGWLPGPAPTVSPVHEFFEKIGLLASTDQNYLVKRVIGLPGDEVKCCSNGHLTVNGVPIDESPYLNDPTQPASAFLFDVTVPAGRIFVLGDNRGDSADSRYHLCDDSPDGLGMDAFVPIQDVVGPVRAVVLPFGRTGHRATPTSVFAKVPSGADPPPSVAKVSVGAGGHNGPCGNG